MTPEQWRRITEVFHLARVRDVVTRAALLDEVCADDLALRADVEEMLAADANAGRFGDTLMVGAAVVPRVAPGTQFGAYRIDMLIGAGGMGEVYRAHDPRLDRSVAIKVVSSGPVADAGARLQLLGEARSAAALNHPHVCTIYEVGEVDGQAYIAMEFIEGQPLDRLIPVSGFPAQHVLRYGLQIAEAMAYAHDRGILHGDLKPGNVMVSELGIPKILDFGLATILSVAGRPSCEFSARPDGASPLLGTAAYMAPEQALGLPTDERSDIFSYGVLLYEMATGRPAFSGATPLEVLDAVRHAEPEPMARIRRDLPFALSVIVQKAFAKDPSQRYQQMCDVALELRRLQKLGSGITASALVAGAAPAVIALVVFALWFVPQFREETDGLPASRIIQMTTLPGLEYSPSWSPDGRSIAYVSDAAGDLDIYIQRIGSGQALRVSDSAADDVQPAWSPDGSRIAFVSARAYREQRLSVLIGMSRLQSILALRNGDVWIVPAVGGPAHRIAQDAYDPAWSPDGKSVVYAGAREGQWGLWIRDVDTPSEPRRLAVGAVGPAPPVVESTVPVPISPNSSVMIQPAWSPDGKWIAFTAGRDPLLQVFVVSSKGGQPLVLTEADANTQMPSWSPDGRWLYFSSERSGRINLYKARFQDGRLGPMHQVTAGSGADLQARFDAQGTRMAYSSVRDVLDLWEYDLTSEQAIRLTSETTDEDNARPSPDGAWLAFTSNRLDGKHLWLLNRRTAGLTQISTAPNSVIETSRWSGDGRYLLSRNKTGSIWQYEVSTGARRKVYEGDGGDGDFCVSADDKYLVIAERSGGIVRVERASANREVVGRLAAGVPGDLACSPDGRWVASHVQRDDDRDIWLISLGGGTLRQLTSGNNEDSHPVWSADSGIVYFLRNHQDVYAVSRAGGEAKPVTHYRSFSTTLDYPALSGDGKKILFTRIDKTGDIYLLEPRD